MPLVSDARQRQARRQAALRESLLRDQGYETYASLAAQRQISEGSVRTWVSHMGDDLFTVRAQGQTLIPAAQLTATGELDRAVSQLVRVLREADMDGWSLWAWLCSPSGLLSGGIPAVVVHASPDRVLRAARRTASDLQAHSGAQ